MGKPRPFMEELSERLRQPEHLQLLGSRQTAPPAHSSRHSFRLFVRPPNRDRHRAEFALLQRGWMGTLESAGCEDCGIPERSVFFTSAPDAGNPSDDDPRRGAGPADRPTVVLLLDACVRGPAARGDDDGGVLPVLRGGDRGYSVCRGRSGDGARRRSGWPPLPVPSQAAEHRRHGGSDRATVARSGRTGACRHRRGMAGSRARGHRARQLLRVADAAGGPLALEHARRLALLVACAL